MNMDIPWLITRRWVPKAAITLSWIYQMTMEQSRIHIIARLVAFYSIFDNH